MFKSCKVGVQSCVKLTIGVPSPKARFVTYKMGYGNVILSFWDQLKENREDYTYDIKGRSDSTYCRF
jgi:hypothetical protein